MSHVTPLTFAKRVGFMDLSEMFVAILLNVKKYKHCECDFGTSKNIHFR